MLHGTFISAIADRSRAFNRGRAERLATRQKWGMADDAWRERIEGAVKRDGRSLRDISLASGLSHGYLHGILRDDKEPTLDRFIRICAELKISLSYALMGVNITPETEAILSALEGDDASRTAVLSLLRRAAS